MAESSNSIDGKIQQLLSRVDKADQFLVHAYVRQIQTLDVPTAIIEYCVLYAFLKVNTWFKWGSKWKIDEMNGIATKMETPSGTGYTTLYGSPAVSKGKHEWKVKIIEPNVTKTSNNVYIGIASRTHCIDSHFWGANGDAAADGCKNYAYLSYASKMDHTMTGSRPYPSPANKEYYGQGDIVTIHLDLDAKTVAFSKNDKYLGIAFENVAQQEYRLAVGVYERCQHKFQLIQ